MGPGEAATDFDVCVYFRDGTIAETLDLENGSSMTLPDGTQIYSLWADMWEGGAATGRAGIALVSSPSTVVQFLAVGTSNVTASGGPANGMTATGVGNSDAGESHFWSSDGTYMGKSASSPGAICFAKGSLIETKRGVRLVEDLVSGDHILTRDNGYQRIVWIGVTHRTKLDTAKHKNLRTIIVRKDAFGMGCPSQDLEVSQQHRILALGVPNCLLFGESETLIAAKHMVNDASILFGGIRDVSYYHLMFEGHEIVRSNNIWTESFLPNPYALGMLARSNQTKFERLFPEVFDPLGGETYVSARYILNEAEAKLLITRSNF